MGLTSTRSRNVTSYACYNALMHAWLMKLHNNSSAYCSYKAAIINNLAVNALRGAEQINTLRTLTKNKAHSLENLDNKRFDLFHTRDTFP